MNRWLLEYTTPNGNFGSTIAYSTSPDPDDSLREARDHYAKLTNGATFTVAKFQHIKWVAPIGY